MVIKCIKQCLTKNDNTTTWYANYESRQADRQVVYNQKTVNNYVKNGYSIIWFVISIILKSVASRKYKCRRLTVLIVDDNPINILIMKKCLSKLFINRNMFEIKEASNGIAALELVNQFQFDIILLDIDMPLLNGIDTTKSIRKNGQNTPIIAVTTNDSIESVDTYIQIGMNHCLSKPINLHLLKQTLIRFLSTSKFDQAKDDIVLFSE